MLNETQTNEIISLVQSVIRTARGGIDLDLGTADANLKRLCGCLKDTGEFEDKIINHYPELGFLKSAVFVLYSLHNDGIGFDEPLHKIVIYSVIKYKEFNASCTSDRARINRGIVRKCLESSALLNQNPRLLENRTELVHELIQSIGRCSPLDPDTVQAAITQIMTQFYKANPLENPAIGEGIRLGSQAEFAEDRQVGEKDKRREFLCAQRLLLFGGGDATNAEDTSDRGRPAKRQRY